MQYLFLADKMTGGEVKEGKEGKERPALPVAGYEPPSWAGKAAPGLHLDVLKVLTAHHSMSSDLSCSWLFSPGWKTDPEVDDRREEFLSVRKKSPDL